MEFSTKTSKGKPFSIIKQQDDPACLRASIGGTEEDGYYLVFRGDIRRISKMISEAKEAIDRAENRFLAQSN